MANGKHKYKIIIIQWLILIVSTAVLLYVVYLTVGNFETLRLRGYIHPLRRLHSSAGFTLSNPENMASWMTFHYLNVEFNLPVDYLKTSLKITDKKYPNMSLNRLARDNKSSSAQVLAAAKKAIESYINQHPQVKK